MTQVFVYGTLKRGGSNHRFLAGQEFIGKAHTTPGYTLYSLGNYPGMVRSATIETNIATGEIWSVDAHCLAQLDELEGINEGLYERVAVTLAPPYVDQTVETYLYLRSLEGRRLLGSTWRG